MLSISAALFSDLRDEIQNKYNNGHIFKASYTNLGINDQIDVYIDENVSIQSEENKVIPYEINVDFKKIHLVSWQLVTQTLDSEKNSIRLQIVDIDPLQKSISYKLPEVHWIKIKAITKAAFDIVTFAVKLAIGLAGIMALWLGLMRIAEKSGLLQYFVRIIFPLLHWLFPAIDKKHPVLGSISLNMAANMLGLGNAATPMGIKAMQQLQELNKTKDRASDEMCMFLAINTSSVQLLPPVTLIAVMGLGVSELILPIILATTASTIAAITSAKLYARARNKLCN